MNTKSFYDTIRPTLFSGKISESQFKGLEAILSEYYRLCVNDPRKLAYILATAYHETAKTFQPIAEYGKGKNYDYGKKIKMSRKPYTTPDKLYYGRGFVQLTWYENYDAMGKQLGLDLLNNPDLLLTPLIASNSIVYGMKNGIYFGRRLDQFISGKMADYNKASRIVGDIKNRFLVSKSAVRFEYWLRKSAIDI